MTAQIYHMSHRATVKLNYLCRYESFLYIFTTNFTFFQTSFLIHNSKYICSILTYNNFLEREDKQTNKKVYFSIVNLQLQVVGYIIHLMAMKWLLVLGKPNRASNAYNIKHH